MDCAMPDLAGVPQISAWEICRAAPGLGGISWRLLNMKDTKIGRAVLEDMNFWATPENRCRLPDSTGDDDGNDLETRKRRTQSEAMETNSAGKYRRQTRRKTGTSEIPELWHEDALAGRKGRGAIDSVMLLNHLRKGKGAGGSDLDVHARDIHSAFNSIDPRIMEELLNDHEDLREWVANFLAPREFDITVDDRVIGSTKMTGGTPQGPPLSPSLFTIYMSAIIRRAQQLDRERDQNRISHQALRSGPKVAGGSCRLLQFIDDCNPIVTGDPRDMDSALTEAAEEFKLVWDHTKDWKSGIHLEST